MMLTRMPGIWLYWHLPVLIVVISLVYSATRYDPWDAIMRETLRWIWRMTAFLGGIGLVLYLLATLPFSTFLLLFLGGGSIVVVVLLIASFK
jgi:hypothetical protein